MRRVRGFVRELFKHSVKVRFLILHCTEKGNAIRLIDKGFIKFLMALRYSERFLKYTYRTQRLFAGNHAWVKIV